MATHGVISAGAQVLFHAAARGAIAGPEKDRVADVEFHVPQRSQIDAADDDISPQQGRVDFIKSKNACQDGKVFSLDECHLSLCTRLAGEMIALDTGLLVNHDGIDDINR